LLSIRALQMTYTPQADAMLIQATSRLYTQKVLATNASSGFYPVAFAPDRKTFAAIGDKHGAIQLRDTQTATILRTFIDPTQITSLAFSPDGKTLGSGNILHTIRVWDVEKGQLLRTMGNSLPADQLGDPGFRVTVTADGRSVMGQSDYATESADGKS